MDGLLASMSDMPSMSTRMLLLRMTGPDGTLRAGDVTNALSQVGFTTEQVRVSLRRLVHDKLFRRDGRGADAVFTLTEEGADLLQPDINAYVYSHRRDRNPEPWDGKWYLAQFTIPEARRSARNELRAVLTSYGAPLGSLYVSPHDWRHLVDRTAERLHIDDCITHIVATEIEVDGTSKPQELARRLWPVADLATGYLEFIERHNATLARLRASSPAAGFLTPLILEATIDYERRVRNDPLLPTELLPEEWPGRRARELIRDVRSIATDYAGRGIIPHFFARYDEALRAYPVTE